MLGLDKAGKDAGLSAAQELHAVVNDAAPKLKDALASTVAEAGRQIANAEDHGIYGLAGLLADLRNTLNGAEIPYELTVTLKGKIGPVRLTVPEQMPAQSVEVRG